MSLSNTAIPKYYGMFRDKVLSGEIKVCRTVSLEMNRIDRLIESPGVYYDSSKVEGWVHFCENELTLTDGSPMHLLDSFKVWGEQVFGWYYLVDRTVYEPDGHGGGRWVNKTIVKRLINKQFIITARGTGKSIYDAAMQGYYLTIDPEATKQFAIAPTVRQAEETISPLKIAINKARGPYFKMLTLGSMQNTSGDKANRPKLFSTKDGIANLGSSSKLETIPMNISKVQGYRPKITTIDEWLSGEYQEDLIGPIEQGAIKADMDYLIIATSSEGTVRNRAGDDIKMELMKILNGEYANPHVSIWYYRLDDISEVNHPSMWIKANPNLGKTVQYDAYQSAVERAEHSPSVRNDTLAKLFGIPLEGFTYFFPYEEIQPSLRRQEFWKMPCSLGCDLSQGDDFCAFTFLFPLSDGRFGIKARSYITEYTLNKLPEGFRQGAYEKFIAEGTLIIMPGTVLDMNAVYDDLSAHIDHMEYDVRTVGFDPYNAKEFISRWETERTPFGLLKVPQGSRTESVPLGEIKKISEKRDLIFDEKIMGFTMGNCIVMEDTNGNRKLLKRRREDKIDNVAALLDAYVAYKANKDFFD